MVKSVSARIHISLDSDDPKIQAQIFRSQERVDKFLRGIFDLQIACELLGVSHPQIHINCVLTNLNLFRFLLDFREVMPYSLFSGNFAFHLIPVVGAENSSLLPNAEQGIYWATALKKRCYVTPTQAFVLPDGSQHRCGAHAIRRPPPLGDVRDGGIGENIRRNLSKLRQLPNNFCSNCAGATCVIN